MLAKGNIATWTPECAMFTTLFYNIQVLHSQLGHLHMRRDFTVKNKNFKIRLNGWSALVVILLALVLFVSVIVFVPLFVMFGLYNILAKFELAHIDLFESFWHDITYFGGFILLLVLLIFALDFLTLFILAAFKIQITTLVDFISILIQMVISIGIFHKFVLPYFDRISMEWLGIIILFTLFYGIIAIFSYEKSAPAEP